MDIHIWTSIFSSTFISLHIHRVCQWSVALANAPLRIVSKAYMPKFIVSSCCWQKKPFLGEREIGGPNPKLANSSIQEEVCFGAAIFDPRPEMAIPNERKGWVRFDKIGPCYDSTLQTKGFGEYAKRNPCNVKLATGGGGQTCFVHPNPHLKNVRVVSSSRARAKGFVT